MGKKVFTTGPWIDDLIALPGLDIEDVPMRLDFSGGHGVLGKPEFCEEKDAMFFADFEIHILSDGEDWQIEDVWMETERLVRGPFFDLVCNQLAERYARDIHDHIDSTLGDAICDSAYEASEYARAS